MRRHHVASTSVRRYFDVMCLLGIMINVSLMAESQMLLLQNYYRFFFLFFFFFFGNAVIHQLSISYFNFGTNGFSNINIVEVSFLFCITTYITDAQH